MYYIFIYINVKNQIHAQELLQILGEAHHTEYPAEKPNHVSKKCTAL